jgi:arylsulfatase A-like enzyme
VEEEPQIERAAFPYDKKSELQHEDPTLVGKAVAVRDKDWTHVRRLYEPPELYHRGDDPHEQTDLAGRPEHTGVERRLHEAITGWLLETGDVIPADTDPRLPAVDLPAPGTAARSGASQ